MPKTCKLKTGSSSWLLPFKSTICQIPQGTTEIQNNLTIIYTFGIIMNYNYDIIMQVTLCWLVHTEEFCAKKDRYAVIMTNDSNEKVTWQNLNQTLLGPKGLLSTAEKNVEHKEFSFRSSCGQNK